MVESEDLTASMMQEMNNVPIVFKAKIKKMSNRNRLENCVLCLSQSHIYLFKSQRLYKKQSLRWVSAFIKSALTEEVVLVFPNTNDLRFVGLGLDTGMIPEL